eukprot:3681216-Lingulodinium_polyedra.AAC.1
MLHFDPVRLRGISRVELNLRTVARVRAKTHTSMRRARRVSVFGLWASGERSPRSVEHKRANE